MSAKCFVKILLIEVLVILGWGKVFADTPDSALLAVENRNGLYFKWSVDGEQWHTIEFYRSKTWSGYSNNPRRI
jgi:hypothetical protein